MTKQTSRDELTSEIKTLLKRYEKEEQSDDARRSTEWHSLLREVNALWLVAEGPVANALQNYLRQEALSAFWAEYFGVSEEGFVAWLKHRRHGWHWYRDANVPRCTAIVKKTGQPCMESAHDEAVIPDVFYIGITDRCYRHKARHD